MCALQVVIFLTLLAGLSGVAHAADGATVLKFQAPPEAQVQEVRYFLKKYKGVPRLHFKVSIKNVSSAPRRFRVRIFLKEGPAIGTLLPRKGKKVKGKRQPAMIAPGGVLSATLPMYYGKLSRGITIQVENFE